MVQPTDPGQIVILNGVPRSGKSSIVAAIQETLEGPWMNLGVDTYKRHVTPKRYSPSIGLRPGGECPDLEPLVAAGVLIAPPCWLLLPALGSRDQIVMNGARPRSR